MPSHLHVLIHSPGRGVGTSHQAVGFSESFATYKPESYTWKNPVRISSQTPVEYHASPGMRL